MEEKQRQSLYYQKNKERLKKYKKEHYFKNKNVFRERLNLYYSKMENKIKRSVRCRILNAVKKQHRKVHYMELLGCDIGFYLKYLEDNFNSKMSWNNYGDWQIDHIVPCSSFDLKNLNEQRKCFFYLNTQPLWKKDNLKKGN